MMCTVSTVDGRINLMCQRIYLISENNHLGSVNHVLAFLAGSLQLVGSNLKSTKQPDRTCYLVFLQI